MEDKKFNDWLMTFIKDYGHQFGIGFYVELKTGKMMDLGTDEHTNWYNDKLKEYEIIKNNGR